MDGHPQAAAVVCSTEAQIFRRDRHIFDRDGGCAGVLTTFKQFTECKAILDREYIVIQRSKISYAVIPMHDQMINPDLERFMTKRAQSQVIELPGSHAIFLSHAPEVAALIEKAATEAK